MMIGFAENPATRRGMKITKKRWKNICSRKKKKKIIKNPLKRFGHPTDRIFNRLFYKESEI